MPYAAKKPCKHPGCSALTDTRYCPAHVSLHAAPRQTDKRPSAAKRGYGDGWRQIRARTLRAYGIPFEDWSKYDLDHNPPYDQAKEPDHTKYVLVPRLRAEHSRKTAKEDGGWGNTRKARV